MIYAIASLLILGTALCWWVHSKSSASYNADGDMWLIAPMLIGWGLIAAAAILALAWGVVALFHHIKFH